MPRRTSSPHQRTTSGRSNAMQKTPEDIDPRWILKAVLLVVFAALICGYLTLCLLFYIGQWQIVLHPKRTTSYPATISGTPVQLLRFAPDESAVPQLTGWVIPAPPSGRHANITILYLPSGDGSLIDAAGTLTALHDLGVNIFAIDYRGYGQSATTAHPSQKVLFEDAESAWQYIHTSPILPNQQLVPYGVGVGASLATHLATSHPTTKAMILESPHVDLLNAALKDDRTKLVPARLLFHERFPLETPLETLRIPKLLLSGSKSVPAFQRALDPRMTVEFNADPGTFSTQPSYAPSLDRFLDQYLPPSPRELFSALPEVRPQNNLGPISRKRPYDQMAQ